MAEVTVNEADSGGTRSLAIGDVLIVQLPENPTTGFRWAIVQSCESILDAQSDDYQIAARASLGGGGERVLRFVARRAGTARLELGLERSWEREPPQETFDLNVTVS